MMRLAKTLMILATLFVAPVIAHEIAMAEMEVRETVRGEFLWQSAPAEKGAVSDELTAVWPDTCRSEANVLHCGEGGLRGTLAIDGVGKRYSAAQGLLGRLGCRSSA